MDGMVLSNNQKEIEMKQDKSWTKREILFEYCAGRIATQEALDMLEAIDAAFEPIKEQVEQILLSPPLSEIPAEWLDAIAYGEESPTLRLVVNNAPSNLKGN